MGVVLDILSHWELGFWHPSLNSQLRQRFAEAYFHLGKISFYFSSVITKHFHIFLSSSTEHVQNFPTNLYIFFYKALVMHNIFKKTFNNIFAIMHTQHKYCKWTLFFQKNTFLTHPVHPQSLTRGWAPYTSSHIFLCSGTQRCPMHYNGEGLSNVIL